MITVTLSYRSTVFKVNGCAFSGNNSVSFIFTSLHNGIQLLKIPSADSRRVVVSYRGKYVQEVLVNHLGGLSLPWKSVVRLTDFPDMTLAVYHVRKTTPQPQLLKILLLWSRLPVNVAW